MTMAASRRGFLKGAAALLASTAIPAAAVGSYVPVGRMVTFTDTFHWKPNHIKDDWRYICRIANIETKTAS